MRSLRIIFILGLLLGTVLGCAQSADIPSFDSSSAFSALRKQVDIGPRYPGSNGQIKCRDYIVSQLKPYADEVTVQDFKHTASGKELPLYNIIARFNSDASKSILLAAHWDSRPIADKEVNPIKQAQPIPGANDGASGVAVLLELAKMFKQRQPELGVIMVFFDGEDYALETDASEHMFLGSKYYAANMDAKAKSSIRFGILLDMIGDKNLAIYQEAESAKAAPEVVKKVWYTARSLGYEKIFIPQTKYDIMDDHVPLIRAGVKCIDIIDFDYGPWHTLDDTVDKCSADSLKVVGEVVAKVIYKEKSN